MSIDRIARLRAETGFVGRAYTDAEREYCEATAYPAEHYAGRWCVKESVRKVVDEPVAFDAIEVCRDESGPSLAFGVAARDAVRATTGLDPADDRLSTAVSLSHDRTTGTATGTVTVIADG